MVTRLVMAGARRASAALRALAGRRPIARASGLLARSAGAAGLLALAGCNIELLNPQGSIGQQEKMLILIALGLMLLVVIPVIGLTLFFAWRYRASNSKANYQPKWAHSTAIEWVVWTIPCLIVAFLAVLIWSTTHTLDPYKSLESKAAPVRVEVVALDWKWLFIYPDYGVASVNRLEIPAGRPIDFKLTSQSMMNSFFIPELGSQIYAMAGMQTQLHLIADRPGTYRGLSSAFSGPGFSDMHFDAVATDERGFQQWVDQAKTSPLTLDTASYAALAKPSEKNPVRVYARVSLGLFDGIVNQYMSGPAPAGAPTKAMAMRHDAMAAE